MFSSSVYDINEESLKGKLQLFLVGVCIKVSSDKPSSAKTESAQVRRARLLNAAAGDWDKKLERAMCFLRVVCSARDIIESQRYLAPRTRKIPKSTEIVDLLLHFYGPNDFRQTARMNR
ncbi:hypothetical protein PsorP6_006423 [Peronosclerospora sorghi]|uniref:Uncharacterized protein n=1 Tax=Peronosclerospora sorghi TaxID=230839 RepID=A0ACC0W5M0_9STRA|nr:hypothetical protein PsorP6_006423 [Peronosclerospora sorghi]